MKRTTLLTALLMVSHLLFSQTFTEQTGISLTGISGGSVAWGDYDNDGDLDILLTGRDISKIYKNNGNNTFTEQTGISLIGVNNGSVAWGDYDNDGYLDILLTGSGISKIYKNNGNNTFTEQTGISLIGVVYSSVAWGDYDNDGDLDILLTGSNRNYGCISKIYKNNSNNTFTEQTGISLTGVSDGSVAWGDYDNDGYLDILLTGETSYDSIISKIYKNNGNNTFSEQTKISLPGVKWSSVTWGDYDNDGDQDILLNGYLGYKDISKIFKNNGNNTFTDQTEIKLAGIHGAVAWGDYDNDGDLDVLLSGVGETKIYKNNGNDTFTEQTGISLTGVYQSSVAWGDYDNDGDLDILLTGETRSDISPLKTCIYKNESKKANVKPTAPIASIPIVDKDNVTFSWGKATDNQTPSEGLSYNIYIKRVSNGSSLMSTMSDITNGFRRIVQLGNLNQVLTYTIKNLDYGEYEWAIQAVDHCFAGSVFSKVQNFKITSPSAPQQLVVTTNSIGEVSLSWVNDSKCELLFVVERSLGNNQNFYPVDTLKSNTYIDKRLTLATHYYYRVKAIFNGISSNYSNEANVETPLFVEQTGISLIGVDKGSVAWGDYDNDGDLDILLTGNDISKIFKNNGNNTFAEQTGIYLIGVRYSSVAWGDYDNDGYLDILLTGYTSSRKYISKIYKNNGNNTFSEQTGILLTGVDNGSVAWGDYDNDGDLDILLTGETASGTYISKIYKNNGNNTFTEQTGILLTGVYNGSVAWGDYDNDGDLDILLTGNSSPKIYKNNGNNTFTEQTEISLIGVDNSSVAWGDYDNDGDLDILLTGDKGNQNYISKIFKNNGNNIFTVQTEISLPRVYGGSVAWGDYDNDGDLDILLSGDDGYDELSIIYKNNGDNTFSKQTEISLTGVVDGSVAWGDYDNDGDLDILLTGNLFSSGDISKVYRNESVIKNTLPSSPNSLKQTVNNRDVTFTWDKADDKETPQNGLSYNLFVQSSDGKIIKSPLSDFSNGVRKVVAIGNVGQNNSWTIKDLPEGNYSWSVQAIDHNFAGSPFAPSKIFSVGPTVVLGKPETPEGATNLCSNSINSEYSTASVPGATSYRWSITPSNAGVITGDSMAVKVDWSDTFNGTAKISVIALNSSANFGISESSDSLSVVVKSRPNTGVISGDQTVCQGTSDHLYKVVSIVGADSYVWSLPQGFTGKSISDSILVSFGNSATSGTIKVQGENSCGVGSENSIAVAVNTMPEKPIVTKSGNVLQSSVASGNQWYKQSELIAGADQKQITSTGDGQYYVIVTENGCPSEPSDVFTVTGVETLKLKGMVEVYPNPVSQNFSVVSAENRGTVDYELIDMVGKVIQKGNFIGKTVVETGGMVSGMYLLKVYDGKTTDFVKIIKE